MTERQKSEVSRDKSLAGKRPQSQESAALLEQADPLSLQRAVADPTTASPADMLALQRSYGNEAVSGLIQTKLTVGPVGDSYEQEADRVAEQVMSMGEPAGVQQAVQRQEEEEELQMKPLAATITPLVQRQEEEEELQMKPLIQRQEEEEEELQMKSLVQRQELEEEEVQMKPALQRQEEEDELQMRPDGSDSSRAVQADGSFEAGTDLESSLAAQKGGGSPLPEQVRAQMEPRFGADFGGVRIHTDDRATKLNRALSSRAFTHGQDIYFRGGDYSPETSSGQKLLAHELTHTVQQGAANRIQGWWPTGHRLVTEIAFEQGNLSQLYDEDARKYLVDRSPDIDFIQDQGVTMDEGIKLGKSQIEAYEKLIKAGQMPRAREMWENNELHYRKPAYMMSHGEGGRYKDADPAAINEAQTSAMVQIAASKWDWMTTGSNMEALSRLSDALHQAEDRGSHGEGRKFLGHDSRLNVLKWAEDHDRDMMPWEKLEGAPPEARTGKWDPDNFSVNKRGGVLGIGFAQGALRLFKQLIGASPADPNAKIALNPGEKSKKRSAKFKSFLPFVTSGNLLGAFVGKSGKGRRTKKKREELRNIFEKRQQLVLTEQMGEEEYEKSLQTPEIRDAVREDPAAAKMVVQGLMFYESGSGFQQEFQDAETQFRVWGKSRFKKGGKKKKERIRLAKQYFVNRTQDIKDNPAALGIHAESILKAYEQVFGNRLYPPAQTPWEELNKLQSQ